MLADLLGGLSLDFDCRRGDQNPSARSTFSAGNRGEGREGHSLRAASVMPGMSPRYFLMPGAPTPWSARV
jgi:hypothetical protein